MIVVTFLVLSLIHQTKTNNMKQITKDLLSNPKNPHYFIFDNYCGIITKDAKIVDILEFKDSKDANKYAKKLNLFATFATHFEFEKITNYKLLIN